MRPLQPKPISRVSMNRINPAKLFSSKWTAVAPERKEKHFMVIEVEYDEAGRVVSCTLEALLSRRRIDIQWQHLKDTDHWIQGWK